MSDISLRINPTDVISQSNSIESLEGTIGYVAIITHVLGYIATPTDTNPSAVVASNNSANMFRVQVVSKELGSVAQKYFKDDFTKLMQAYTVKRPENLVGKPVIAVYNGNEKKQLLGLLPLPNE